jgi:hypothetical protein
LVKKDKIRLFSRLGLIVIGEYFEKCQELDQANKVIMLLEKLVEDDEERKIDKEIRYRTSENCSSLTVKRNRYWIDFKDLGKILKTNNERLRKAFQDIQRSDLPLIIEEDFEDIEKIRYYSFSGLERICIELSEQLSKRDRRLYVKRVPKIAIPVMEKVKLLPERPSDKDITNAMNQARRLQRKKCQITGESESETTLAVHHLYDKSTYSYLAADQDNLLVIKESIHKEFHNWNEGYIKPCTIDDFISFLENHPEYSQKIELLIKLDDKKYILKQKLKPELKSLPESYSKTINESKNQIEVSNSEQTSIYEKTVSAIINNKKETGKIIAITRYVDKTSYCFQIKKGEVGIWISESNLIIEE